MTEQSIKKEHSIRSQLLKWLLIPTLALVVIDSTVLYHFAGNLEQKAFDRGLLDTANDIAQFLKESSPKGLVALNDATKHMLLSDSSDKMFYSVKDMQGNTLLGEASLEEEVALPAGFSINQPSFYFSEINQQEIRVVSMPTMLVVAGKTQQTKILVAETLNKRRQLSQQILAWILVPQIILLIAAGMLVLVGIKRGLSSLWEVNDALATRSYRDLEPIKLTNTPREIKRLVDSANGLMSKLDQAIHSQSRFIADAAHQLRTPLAGIRAQIELADQSQKVPEIKDRLQKISISTERLIHLVNQLLILEKNQPEASHQVHFEALDLVDVVKKVVAELTTNAEIKHIELVYLGAQESVVISGDKPRIHDLVYNLVDNAIRYTPSYGNVVTELYVDENQACLNVQDNGVGIAEDELNLVFERFYRANQNSDFGTGLGLAIVKEIAALHNASVDIESKQGAKGGTKFKVRFNLATV